MGKEWAGIVRVSHMGARRADASDFHAERDQEEQIRGAVPKGDTLTMLPPELGVSGGLTIDKRPSLLAAVEGIESGRFGGLIVGYLSRLGRNLGEQLKTYDRVHAAGGRIIVAQEGIDALTRHGRLQRNILAAIHEDEREAHVERFAHLRKVATEAGIWQARQTPLGYTRDPASRKLVPDADAARVRRAFTDRNAGASISSIAERLGMTTSGVRHLLRNRVYLGELSVGEHTNLAAHPAIVSVEEFEAVQSEQARPARRAKAGPALLAGLVRCASCGHVMTRTTTASEVYKCHGRHSGGRCPEPAAVTTHLLDALVTEAALPELRALQVTARMGRNLDDVRERLARAEQEQVAYLEAVSALDIDPKALQAGATARQERIDETRAELRGMLAVAPALPDTDLDALWETLDAHGRNTLLRGLLEAVVVRRAGGRGAPRPPLADRVRLVKFGAGLGWPRKRAEAPAGIVGVFPDADDPCVLRMPRSQ